MFYSKQVITKDLFLKSILRRREYLKIQGIFLLPTKVVQKYNRIFLGVLRKEIKKYRLYDTNLTAKRIYQVAKRSYKNPFLPKRLLELYKLSKLSYIVKNQKFRKFIKEVIKNDRENIDGPKLVVKLLANFPEIFSKELVSIEVLKFSIDKLAGYKIKERAFYRDYPEVRQFYINLREFPDLINVVLASFPGEELNNARDFRDLLSPLYRKNLDSVSLSHEAIIYFREKLAINPFNLLPTDRSVYYTFILNFNFLKEIFPIENRDILALFFKQEIIEFISAECRNCKENLTGIKEKITDIIEDKKKYFYLNDLKKFVLRYKLAKNNFDQLLAHIKELYLELKKIKHSLFWLGELKDIDAFTNLIFKHIPLAIANDFVVIRQVISWVKKHLRFYMDISAAYSAPKDKVCPELHFLDYLLNEFASDLISADFDKDFFDKFYNFLTGNWRPNYNWVRYVNLCKEIFLEPAYFIEKNFEYIYPLKKSEEIGSSLVKSLYLYAKTESFDKVLKNLGFLLERFYNFLEENMLHFDGDYTLNMCNLVKLANLVKPDVLESESYADAVMKLIELYWQSMDYDKDFINKNIERIENYYKDSSVVFFNKRTLITVDLGENFPTWPRIRLFYLLLGKDYIVHILTRMQSICDKDKKTIRFFNCMSKNTDSKFAKLCGLINLKPSKEAYDEVKEFLRLCKHDVEAGALKLSADLDLKKLEGKVEVLAEERIGTTVKSSEIPQNRI